MVNNFGVWGLIHPAAVRQQTSREDSRPHQTTLFFRYRYGNHMQSSPPPSFHSFHNCVNGDFHWTGFKRRTCAFNNVCWLSKKDAQAFLNVTQPQAAMWVYVDAYALTSTDDTSTAISPLTIKVATRPAEILPQDKWGGRKLSFHVAQAGDANVRAHVATLPMKRGLHLLYESYNAQNIGHFFGDELLPLFRLADVFDRVGALNTSQVLRWVDATPLKYSCESKEQRDENFGEVPAICGRFYRTLFPLLTDKPMKVINASHTESFCAEEVLVGMGMLSDHCEDATDHGRRDKAVPMCNLGVSSILWRYRGYLLDRARRITPPAELHAVRNITSSGTYILVALRASPGRLPPDIEPRMRALAQNLSVAVHFVDWVALTMAQQLEVTAHASVLVSAVGGAAFVGLFLPRGATLLLVTEHHRDRYLDFGFFSALAYLRTHFFVWTLSTDVNKSLRNLLTRAFDAARTFPAE